jgi:NADPH:quinone reductase-like Zn-dependent oxidoreductase
MKAIVYTQYGSPDVLQLKEVVKPEPKEDQVLVKIHAASANALDYRRFEKISTIGKLMEERMVKSVGKVFGADIAGVVESVGANVKQFKPGDEVFGVAVGLSGGFAEYASANENHLTLKPANLSFEAAAAVPVAAMTAIQGLRDKGQIRAGQKVLIIGASGGVGTFAVQIAKSFGTEVTAVCSSRNVDIARSIGADHVVDYIKEDFTKNGKCYDLIFAVNGNHPLSAYQHALNPQGIYVCAGGTLSQIFQAMLLGPSMSRKNGKKMGFMGITKYNQKDLVHIKKLLESGKIVPVIEKHYPLSEASTAMRYLAQGHAKAKIVFQIG